MSETPEQSADKVTPDGDHFGAPVYIVETSDIGAYQTYNGRVWKILHDGKKRELTKARDKKAMVRVIDAVQRFKPMQVFIFTLRTGSYGTFGKSTYEQEGRTLEDAVIALFERFKAGGLLAYFSSLEHIGTEAAK
jgi:hypothetical protein